jgi:hypothetical protein
MLPEVPARLSKFPAVIRDCFRWPLLVVLLAGIAWAKVSAEIVFQDFFTQPAANVTNSVPWIDVQGKGWQSGAATSQLALDGSGHLYNAALNAPGTAGVQLVPIGPHGSLTATAMVQLPMGSTESIDMGFCNTNQFLTASASGSGPWIQVFGTGTINFCGGPGLSNQATLPNAFTNHGDPVQILLAYDAFHATASVGTVSGGATNLVVNQWPVTNSPGSITAQYFVLQFSTNLTTPTARWATAATVDWLPRPPPMLTLPVPLVTTLLVGSPGSNDIELIQNALNLAAASTNATEILFTAGATYVLTNGSLSGDDPIILLHATNVLVNGNGCKILITNPRIGFLDVNRCSNILVQGFTVDYDPLPFTQGTVTHNFYTSNDVPKEKAFEFVVDAGYPAPTNANYIDANAVSTALRWGMVMDPAHPGRVAVGAYSQCYYTNVVQTNGNGAFKVYLSSAGQVSTIQPGDLWCMISRWNTSIDFQSFESYQVTFLNNTNYAAAGESYVGQYSPLSCELNDQIQFGPPPAGATAPRRRTSNSDGGLFIESRIGPWVQGCNFIGLSDDTANACLNPFLITNAPALPTDTFAVFKNSSSDGTPSSLIPFEACIGDTFDFFNATNGVVFDRATVTAVSLPNITFDHPITNVVSGTYDTNTLLVNENLNTSAVYLGNQFSNSAFHGIYCRAHNILIAHNTVSGIGYNAITALPLIVNNFLDLFLPTNVVIMDNVLSDCGFDYQALHNAIPTEQALYALVALYKADATSDYVADGLEISGIRILYNAFLDWRRAPLTLHNATDVNIVGNYFGPPVTNDGLAPLTNDVIADLWASDYPNLRFSNNVNATALPDSQTIDEDGTTTVIADAFQLPTAPMLTANLSGANFVVSWVSPSPGFQLQQIDDLGSGTNNWVDSTNTPWLAGESNIVTLPLSPGVTHVFFRARQQ